MNDLSLSQKLMARTRSAGLLALFLIVGLPCLVTPVHADNPPTYLFQWGSLGTNNAQFNVPAAAAIDGGNNVYVTDVGNRRIEKFDVGGNYLTQWGSSGYGNGQFEQPEGIAIDSSNNIYVADYGNFRIEKFDSNGNYLTQWGGFGTGNGQFQYAGYIAIDHNNAVYVADGVNNRIQKFDSNGNYLTQWGTFGTGNGQFDGPEGIAVDNNNNIYVADDNNSRIEKFDSNGNYLTQWGSAGTGNGQFETPGGIAIDSSNHVYVADLSNDRIEKFDSNGSYLTQWGSYGIGNGQFNNAEGVAVSGSGNLIYVADTGNSRIQVFVNQPAIVPPIITTQPATQEIAISGNISFNVTVVGAAPFVYQWTSNNVAILNATNSTFSITNVNFADTASYAVLVSNNFGSALSSSALLTVMPTLVTTLPASGISATGSVLNGLAMVGADETIAWFDWGTTTNYGNIADITIIADGGGTTNLSVALNGLPGNIYHYQLDALNDFGIIYGNDVSFTNGFAPLIITNFLPVNSANGTTLSASVNPEGWDTTVYFTWGVKGGLLTNSTPLMDAGAGAVSLNVSSLIAGLPQTSGYSYQVVASNFLGSVSSAVISFLPFPFANVPPATWQSVACSADGSKLIAAANAEQGARGGVYISTNNGVTWNVATNLSADWEAVAMSADGSKLFAAIGQPSAGPIYTNLGTTFVPSISTGAREWNAIASSADGTRIAAVNYSALVSTSTNSGATWTIQTGAPDGVYIASSADGVRLIVATPTLLYASTNRGVNWARLTNAPIANWYSVASSANGNELLACSYSMGNVYSSTNAGVNWTKTSLPTNNWNSVAMSADGTKAVALANSGNVTFGIGNGGIWTSTDSGNTWVSNNVPSASWTCAAMSADGNEYVAVMGYPSFTGGIYVGQTTPAPVLSLSVSNNTLISWIVPSLSFTLQQSPDLLNWAAVTNVPVLNFSNLENQVALPSAPAGNSFYRLKH
ncbi:MAG TPA: SMP-30/gluconolactonase/LRE family protein [Pseudomonadales bacterium]|nr:SMP-30/gluconolactonase/LRE family protein [Pseudomonadales bacterium]